MIEPQQKRWTTICQWQTRELRKKHVYRTPTLPISQVSQPRPPTLTLERTQRGYTSSKPVRRLYRVATIISSKGSEGFTYVHTDKYMARARAICRAETVLFGFGGCGENGIICW